MNFKELAEIKGLGPKQISDICQVSLATAYNWLSGKSEPKMSQWKIIESYVEK